MAANNSKWYTSLDQVSVGGLVAQEPMQIIKPALELWREENSSEYGIHLVFSPADLFSNHWSSESVFEVFDAARAAHKQLFVFLSNAANNMSYMANWWIKNRKIKQPPANIILMARATNDQEAQEAARFLGRAQMHTGLLLQPLQGPVTIQAEWEWLSWVVAGGAWDSFGDGLTATPTHWFYGVYDRCKLLGIPFWFAGYGRFVDVDEAVASGSWARHKNEHPGASDPPFHYEQGHPVPYVALAEHIMPTKIRGHACQERPEAHHQLVEQHWLTKDLHM